MTKYRDVVTAIMVGIAVGIGWVLLVSTRPTVPTYAERPSAQRAEDALQEIRAHQTDVLVSRTLPQVIASPTVDLSNQTRFLEPETIKAARRVTPVFARETQFVGSHR